MRARTALEIEIFGCDEPIVPSTVGPHPAPWDDPLWPYQPADHSADVERTRLLDEQFISNVFGLTPSELRKLSNPRAAEPEISNVFTKTAAATKKLDDRLFAIVNREFSLALIPIRSGQIIAKRKAALASRAPLRKRHIQRLIEPLRALFRDTESHEEDFERLIVSMEAFVTNAIISEA